MALALKKTTSAVTYSFRDDDHCCGWSCCTVNEDTGELSITSDWGNWSHRWNVRHLGAPSLHAFIGRGSLDYLANKLIPGSIYVFDAEETTAELRRQVIEARREGRLTRDQARECWEDLGSFAADAGGSSDVYLMRYLDSDTNTLLGFDEPWEFLRSCTCRGYRDLMQIVLPPLVEVCRNEAPKHAKAEPQ